MRRVLGLLALVLVSACECVGPALNVLVPAIEVRPSTVAFELGYVGYEAHVVVTLASTGGAPLALEGVLVRGDGFALRERFAAVVVEPGQSVELGVVFAPSAAGAFAGELEVMSDAQTSPVLVVPLSATGVSPPDCEDLGPCTVGLFDPSSGACGFDILEGACDDGSGCTTGDTCVSGRCVGEATDCGEPPAACMVGLCSTQGGCSFLPVHESCDDGDPCTLDECTAAGCTNPTAPDGTSCGAASCAGLFVCVAGQCEELATPDGFPCADGDVCTSGDACLAGECVGEAVVSDGEVLGASLTFAAQGGAGAVLNDGRIVMLDFHEHDRGTIVTLLERVAGAGGDELVVTGQAFDDTLSQRTRTHAPFGAAGLALLYDDGTLSLHDTDGLLLSPRGELDLWEDAPAYLAPSLAAVDEEWLAACHARKDELYIVETADPAAPELIATIPLPAACEHLVADRKQTGMLYASLDDTSVMRVTLSTPVHVQEVLPAGGRLVAASDGRYAIGRLNDELPTVSSVELYDAATDSLLATIAPPLGGGVFPTVEAISLEGRWLTILTTGPLYAVDVSDPQSPVLQVVADDDGGVHNATGARVLSTDGETLVRSFSGGFWDRFHILDVSAAAPRELEHARRGGVRTFAREGGRLYALAQSAVRIVETSDPASPLITSGKQLFRRQNALWGLGAGGGLPLYPHGYGPAAFVSGSQALLWLDGQDAAAPTVVGTANVPFLSGVLSVVSDGRRAYALRITYADEPFFDVYDLAALVPDADSGPPIPLASLPLELPGAEVNNFERVTLTGTRVVAVMQHDWTGTTPLDALRSELLLIDVTAAAEPAVLGRASFPGHLRQGRAHDDVVLAVQRTSGPWYGGDEGGEQVVRLVFADGRLEVDATLPLEHSGAVLFVDEARAVVATRDGVAFLSHGPGALSLRSELPLPLLPTDATFVGEALWLAGEHGVVSTRVPCP